MKKKMDKKQKKVKKVLHEFKEGELHSGSKKGPVVKKRSQAVAIALSEGRKVKK
jgi:ribosomal protein L21E